MRRACLGRSHISRLTEVTRPRWPDERHSIVYTTPSRIARGNTLFTVIMSGICVVVLPAAVALILTAMFNAIIGLVWCGIALLIGIAITIGLWRTRMIRWIDCSGERIILGGPCVRRCIEPGDVTLLTFRAPEGIVLTPHYIIGIEKARSRCVICLPLEEAIACFERVRVVCAESPAIGPDFEEYDPVAGMTLESEATLLNRAMVEGFGIIIGGLAVLVYVAASFSTKQAFGGQRDVLHGIVATILGVIFILGGAARLMRRLPDSEDVVDVDGDIGTGLG